MKETKKINSSLNELLDKFAQNDVIAVLEEEYNSQPSKLIKIDQIEDNHIVSSAKLRNSTLERFSEGIKKNGVYSPLIVREKDGHYELILGRRRFHGSKLAGLEELPCLVVSIEEEEMLLVLLADIRDQKEANLVEMALVLKQLNQQYGYSHQNLAQVSHLSRSQITNILRILNLPEKARDLVATGEISYGHAKAIASLSDEQILSLVDRIKKENLSVRAIEKIAQEVANPSKPWTPDIRKLKSKSKAESIKISKRKVVFSFAKEKDLNEFLHKLDK